MIRIAVVLCLGGMLVSTARAELVPADLGGFDVRAYGAVGDGIADDTAAVQAAYVAMVTAKKRILVIPDGVYRLSAFPVPQDPNGLWINGVHLIGAGSTRTTLRLIDGSPGFTDPNAPKPWIVTASLSNPNNADGSGDSGTHNHIRGFALDLGNNPGVIGIDFQANNVGSIRDVRMLGSACYAAIAMERKYPGPLLVQDVDASRANCQYGARIARTEYSVVLDRVRLIGTQAPVWLSQNSLTLLRSTLTAPQGVPAVKTADTKSLVVAVSSALYGALPQGHTPTVAAVDNGQVLARDTTACGFTGIAPGLPSTCGGFAATNRVQAFPLAALRPLGLPLEPAPSTFYVEPGSQWQSVVASGAFCDDVTKNSGPAFQAALNSGKPIVYAPRCRYAFTLSAPITIPATVETIYFYGANLMRLGSATTGDLFVIPAGTGTTPLTLHGMHDRIGQLGVRGIVNLSQRPLRLVDDLAGRIEIAPGAGPLWLEDTFFSSLIAGSGVHVTGVQANPEDGADPSIVCDGAQCVFAGLKSEGGRTLLHAKNGACAEVLGGLAYPVSSVPMQPLFVCEDSSCSYSIAESSYFVDRHYPIVVHEVRGPLSAEIYHNSLTARGFGALLALAASHVGGCP